MMKSGLDLARKALVFSCVVVLLGCQKSSDDSLARRTDTPTVAATPACDSRALQDAMTVISSSVAGFEQAPPQIPAARDSMAQLSIAAVDMAYRHRACLMSRYEFGYDIFFAQHFQRWLQLARTQKWQLAEQAKALDMVQRFEALSRLAPNMPAPKPSPAQAVKTAGHHGGTSAFKCSPILFEDSMRLVRTALHALERMPEQARQSRHEASYSIRLAARRASEHASCAAKAMPDAQWIGHLHTVAALINYNKTQSHTGKTDAYIGAVATELQAACESNTANTSSSQPRERNNDPSS
jgi:hypothetical protein